MRYRQIEDAVGDLSRRWVFCPVKNGEGFFEYRYRLARRTQLIVQYTDVHHAVGGFGMIRAQDLFANGERTVPVLSALLVLGLVEVCDSELDQRDRHSRVDGAVLLFCQGERTEFYCNGGVEVCRFRQ